MVTRGPGMNLKRLTKPILLRLPQTHINVYWGLSLNGYNTGPNIMAEILIGVPSQVALISGTVV